MEAAGKRRYRAEVVVTCDPQGAVFAPGVVEVTGDRLSYVGAEDGAPTPPGEVVDLGGLLMPGLVNAHAHSAMTLLRGAGDGLPLDRWLREVIWPREAHLGPDDVYWGATLGFDELLRGGVTTTCEMYVMDQAVVDAAVDAGIRCVSTPGIFDLPGQSWQVFLERAVTLHQDNHGRDGRITVGLGPHSVYVLPEEALSAAGETARKLDTLLHLHLAETKGETEEVEARYGCSGPELLERLGVFEGRCLAAHSVWLDDADLERYRLHDVAVAHCPGSNAKLGSGTARVTDMLALGLRVGVATDGPASNDDLDLFDELRLGAMLARAVAADPVALSTAQALSLATTGGAAALGLEVGSLEAGRLADFIRLDLEDSRLLPVTAPSDLLSHLVWAADGSVVTDTWVAGRRVVADRACVTLDAPRARHEVRRRAQALLDAAGG
jgi:5-methylthioadenosine/S-adenosylhomocysteine deaminase